MVHEEGLRFYVAAYYLGAQWTADGLGDPATPVRVTAEAEVTDLQAARAIAGMFPVYVKVKAMILGKFRPGDARMSHVGLVQLDVKLIANETNKGRNEKGIERYRRFLDECGRHGWRVDFGPRPGSRIERANMYDTREAFHAALGLACETCGAPAGEAHDESRHGFHLPRN